MRKATKTLVLAGLVAAGCLGLAVAVGGVVALRPGMVAVGALLTLSCVSHWAMYWA